MLACYGDESVDMPKQEHLCVGAFLGWPESLHRVSLDWIKRLEKDNIGFFHAAECEGLYGQFSPERLGVSSLNSARAIADSLRFDLLNIIRGEGGIGGIALAVKQQEFLAVINESPKAKSVWGTDPIVFAYKQLAGKVMLLLDEEWPEQQFPVSFTFDEHRKWKEAEDACASLKTEDPIFARRLGHVGHADDRQAIPLQMADLMAFEARLKARAVTGGSDETRAHYRRLTEKHAIWYVGWVGREHMLDKLRELESTSV